jgi:transposase
MYNCSFSDHDIAIIKHDCFHHPSSPIRKRMNILWHKTLNYPHHEIARVCDVCPNTVTATLRRYQEGGIEKVRERHVYQPQSDLQQYRTVLKKHFQDHPPATLKEAAVEIEKITALKRSQSSVRLFFLP